MIKAQTQPLNYEARLVTDRPGTTLHPRLIVAYSFGALGALWFLVYPGLIYHGSNSLWYAWSWREYVLLRSVKFLAIGAAIYGAVCAGLASSQSVRSRLLAVGAFALNSLTAFGLATEHCYGE